ncbi:MAG: hypothetical protein ABI844_08690 [Saprospiraceae bacterium]
MPKKIAFLPVFLFILLTYSCRQKPEFSLVDRWKMIGDSQVMYFDSDTSLIWLIQNEFLEDTFIAEYKIDTNKLPMTLDVYNFNRGILKDKILVGIVKPYGNDTLLIDFTPIDDWPQADSIRPKSFNPEEMKYLVRIK